MQDLEIALKDANNLLQISCNLLESYSKYIVDNIINSGIKEKRDARFYQIIYDIVLDVHTVLYLIQCKRITQAFTLYRGAIEKVATLDLLTNNETLIIPYLECVYENIEFMIGDKEKKENIMKKYNKDKREIKYFLQYKWCLDIFKDKKVTRDEIIKKANLEHLLQNKEFLDNIVHGITYTTLLLPNASYYETCILFAYESTQLVDILYRDLCVDKNIHNFQDTWRKFYGVFKAQLMIYTNKYKHILVKE